MACVIVASAAPGSQQPDPQATVAALKTATGFADKSVAVPLTLMSAAGVTVGKLELSVTFAKDVLSFVKVEASGLSDVVDAAISSSAGNSDSNSRESQATVSISTIGTAKRLPLRDGAIAYLVFRIAKDTAVGTIVHLNMTGRAVTVDDPPAAVQPLVVNGANIEIVPTPIPACFFYMH